MEYKLPEVGDVIHLYGQPWKVWGVSYPEEELLPTSYSNRVEFTQVTIDLEREHKREKPTLSATISAKPAKEGNITGLDVTCGDTTFIPVEVEDDDSG